MASSSQKGTAQTCAKQPTHYPSFRINGITVTVNSFAIIRTKEERHYLGYLKDIFDNRKGEKIVRVQLFQHFQEVQYAIPQLEGHPREVLITPHAQVIYAKCIDAPATVLTPSDYDKYISLVPKSLSCNVYMCSREFRNKKVMPFSLWELDGYYKQTIFTILRSQDSQLKSKGHMLHEVKHITRVDPSTQGPRGSRRIGESCHSSIRKSIPANQIAKAKPPKLRLKFQSRGPAEIQFVEPQYKTSFGVGDNLEVLCHDSGMRGCWFRVKVLKISQKNLKVQYDDILDCDRPEKLEEWIPSYKVAGPDNLGMRCTGRLTIRPRPLEDLSDYSFEVGAAVDAWWCDGWWEGVVARSEVCGSGHLQVYFPGENKLLDIERNNVRISRDWIDGKWVEVKIKKDVKSFISSSLTDASKCSIKEPLCQLKTTSSCQLLNTHMRSQIPICL